MDERRVIRCRSCNLNQFLPSSGNCRRCHIVLEPPPESPIRVEVRVKQKIQSFDRGESARGRYYGFSQQSCSLGFALKLIRLAHGYSQKDMERFGYFRTYISKLENGKAIPGLESLRKLAEHYETSAYAVISFAELLAQKQNPQVRVAQGFPLV